MALLKKSDSGVAFLNELQKLKNALGLDLGNSALESVFNEISQQNISAASKYLDQARLLAGASVAVRKRGLSLTVIAGLLLGHFRHLAAHDAASNFKAATAAANRVANSRRLCLTWSALKLVHCLS